MFLKAVAYGRFAPTVRARYETSRAIVWRKRVDHQDETEERPVCGGAFYVHVDVQHGGSGSEGSRVQCAQLERRAYGQLRGIK
jgi:hypothetical protein